MLVIFIKCHVLSLTKFGEKVWNWNKPAPYIELLLHKMGDINHFLDDVTRFSPISKNEPGPVHETWSLDHVGKKYYHV